MHNQTDNHMESHDESERENRSESECDVDTESYLSASSSSATEITDPVSYAGKSLTNQDKFELLTSSGFL